MVLPSTIGAGVRFSFDFLRGKVTTDGYGYTQVNYELGIG